MHVSLNLKRTLILAVKIIATICILFIAIVGSILYWRSLPKTDRIWIRNADFQSIDLKKIAEQSKKKEYENPPSYRELNIYGHRIKAGKGVVIGYRFFHDVLPFVFDDEIYEKVTIWMPELVGGTYDLSNAGAPKVYYSKGGAAWPEGECSSDNLAGKISVESIEGSLVKVGLDLTGECTRHAWKENAKVSFKDIGYYEAKQLNELTPWLGAQGEHPYDETYR